MDYALTRRQFKCKPLKKRNEFRSMILTSCLENMRKSWTILKRKKNSFFSSLPTKSFRKELISPEKNFHAVRFKMKGRYGMFSIF